jgi:elongator complex protein 3
LEKFIGIFQGNLTPYKEQDFLANTMGDQSKSPKERREIDPSDISNWKESPEIIKKACRDVIETLISKPDFSKDKLTQLKCRVQKKYHIAEMLKDSLILKFASEDERELLGSLLRRRYTRTISGVTIVAVMTKPMECPGKCMYCPGPASQPHEKVAQSYTGREPAAMRSIMYDYDPYEQTFHRLLDQKNIGHEVDKIELIIMGGTFLSAPDEYQINFIHGCFDAIINYGKPNYNQHERSNSLEEAKLLLETAETKLIGLTFETRPDYCTEKYIDRILELGGTRIELGVQTTRDDVLAYINRGHDTKATIHAIKLAKDAGLKINAHMMPNLPLSTPESDLEMFRELFKNPNYRPDMLKIYPTLVIGGTELASLFENQQYTPYSQEEIVKLIAKVKTELPYYVRIQRIQRDIPVNLILAGVKNSNLRQLVEQELKQQQQVCRCIRCREEGFMAHTPGEKAKQIDLNSIFLQTIEYEASDGKELFISFEDKERSVLIGFVRLRIPSKAAYRPEINQIPAAIVREIRVVGELVKISDSPGEHQVQHRGYGKALMKAAEEYAQIQGCKKILVISGIGARGYFYKLGYQPDGPYVSKML